MGLLRRVSAERHPLDRNAMAIIRKKMPIPSCSSWTVSLET
jgi:beta-lactamase class D